MYLSLDIEGSMKPTMHPWQPEAYISTVSIVTGGLKRKPEEKSWVFCHAEALQREVPFELAKTDREQVAEIQAYIDSATVVVAHNAKFDINWCMFIGLDFTNVRIFCTSVAEFILSGQTLKLDELALNVLAKKYFDEEKYDKVKTEYWDEGVNTHLVPLDILLPYNIQDCRLTLKLFELQINKLREQDMIPLMSSEMDKLRCLCEIETTGFKIDTIEMDKQGERLTGELLTINTRLQELAGMPFNPGSGKQLSAVMFGGTWVPDGMEEATRTYKSGLVRTYTRKCQTPVEHEGLGFIPDKDWETDRAGTYSTAKDVLTQLKPQAKTKELKEFMSLLFERSAKAQENSTFIEGMRKHLHKGKVHSSMNQTITITGRLSSSRPNIENIPRGNTSETKKIFLPSKDKLVEADFSQLEWRIAAFLSQCPVMLQEIRAGIDQHAATGAEIFNGAGTRTDWKIFSFRLIYGGTPYAFYMDFKMPSFSQKRWRDIVESFYEKYYGLKAWHDGLLGQVRKNGGELRSPTSRVLKFKKYETKHGWDYKRPQALNYPVQSFAGDIVALSMKIVKQKIDNLNLDAVMINQIHDAILYDCSDDCAEQVAKIMVEVFREMPQHIEEHYGFRFNLPLDGDAKIGSNWYNMKEVKV